MFVISNVIYRFIVLIKETMSCFEELVETILTFIWNLKKNRIAKTILSKKNQQLLYFKAYYKAVVIKTT